MAKRVRRKRHHSERFRGPNLLIERWTNAKAGHVGFNLGMAKSTVEVSKILADGTSPETIRSIAKKWRLPLHKIRKGKRGVLVQISPIHGRKLDEQAAKLGISSEEFARRILECSVSDNLYGAITDGRFK